MGCFFGCFRFKPNDQAIDDVICPKVSYSRSKEVCTRSPLPPCFNIHFWGFNGFVFDLQGFNLVRQERNTSKKNQLSSMFLCEGQFFNPRLDPPLPPQTFRVCIGLMIFLVQMEYLQETMVLD